MAVDRPLPASLAPIRSIAPALATRLQAARTGFRAAGTRHLYGLLPLRSNHWPCLRQGTARPAAACSRARGECIDSRRAELKAQACSPGEGLILALQDCLVIDTAQGVTRCSHSFPALCYIQRCLPCQLPGCGPACMGSSNTNGANCMLQARSTRRVGHWLPLVPTLHIPHSINLAFSHASGQRLCAPAPS